MESQQRCIRTLTHQATSLTFSSDGKTLVSFSNNDKTANVWDVETGELKKTFTGLTSITLSLDGKTLADSNKDNTIKLWDVETGELKNSLTGHSSNILFIAFSPDGKTLVSRDEETIKFWNICTGKLKSSMAHSYNRKESIWRTTVFSPNGQTLAISSTRKREDGTFYKTITLWDVETGQVVRTLRNEGRRMQMNTGLLDDLDQFEYCVGWGTIDSNPYYHGDNDEYFKTAWKKTKKGYYPREVHQENGSGTCTSSTALNQIFDKIRTVTDPPATIET